MIKRATLRAMTLLVGVTWILSTCYVVAAPEPSWDAIPGNLPKSVVPQHYSISIQPNIEDKTFKGSESIDLEVRKAGASIILNSRGLKLFKARLVGKKSQEPSIQTDDQKQTVTLKFPQTLRAGQYKLELQFEGKIGSQGQGLYYGKYPSEEGEKVLLATQLEPTDARQVFPCWDEPAFRATFQLTVDVPQGFLAVSNMPIEREEPLADKRKRVTFGRTPKMSSYLVALVAGELEALSGEVDGTPLRIITTRGKKQNGQYALEITQKLLAFYNDYFGLKYPLPKLDQIAIPGGFLGAMENWGAITYIESALLFDPKISSQETRETVFNVVAHEIAHQWFGDLVTLAWWDDTWLNEAFASWMQVKAADHFNPGWNIRIRSSRSKNWAMATDALNTTHPIRLPIANPTDVIRSFDEITYDKGGAVLLMLEAYLGQEVFRDGLRKYVSAHQYSNATAADLWSALDSVSGKPVSTMARGWIEQPGFPLVRAQSSCQEGKQQLILQQQRFMLTDVTPSQLLWQIPVTTARVGSGQPTNTLLLKDRSLTVAAGDCETPIKLNAGDSGYYRVQYSEDLLKALRRQLSTNLGLADRLNLLRDSWALTEAGQGQATDYLDLVEGLRAQTSQPLWEDILDKLNLLDNLYLGSTAHDEFRRYGRSLLAPVLTHLGWDARPGEEEGIRLLRNSLITTLGRFGDETVIAESRLRFQQFLKDQGSLQPDLREAVFGVVGRHSDRATYDRLHELGRQAKGVEERMTFYQSMQVAQDPKLAEESLQISLTDELPPGFAAYSVYWVAFGGQHRELAWAFVRAHLKELMDKVDLWGRINYAPNLMTAFSDAAKAAELENFAKEHLKDSEKEVAKAAEKIRLQASLKEREIPRINEWLRRRGL